jgi:hypothetical protein
LIYNIYRFQFKLTIQKLLFKTEMVEVRQAWLKELDLHPAHQGLRELIKPVARSINVSKLEIVRRKR